MRQNTEIEGTIKCKTLLTKIKEKVSPYSSVIVLEPLGNINRKSCDETKRGVSLLFATVKGCGCYWEEEKNHYDEKETNQV